MAKKSHRNKQEEKLSNTQIVIHKYPSFIEWIVEWIGNTSLNISNSKSIKWFFLILLAIIILVYYPTQLDDYDIWWHLKLGEHYIKNLTVRVDHSIFSWTPADPGYLYNTFLGSTIFYIAFKIASGFGLWLLQWSIFISLFFLFFYYIKSINDSLDVNCILGILFVGIALNLTAIYYKPEIFTTLFFTITVFIYFYSKLFFKKLFFLYPIIFMIWVNLHGGFLAGLFFITIVLAGELFNYFVVKNGQIPKYLLINLAIAVPASYVAVLINPYGISYHKFILKSLFLKEYMSYAAQVVAYKSMWQFLFPKEYLFRFINTAWVITIMAGLLSILGVYAYRKKRHFDITVFIINAIFFYLGMSAGRYTIFFPSISFFSILYTLKKVEGFHFKKKFGALSLLIFLFCAGNIVYNTVSFVEHRAWFGQNMDLFVPVKEVEYIEKHKIQPPLFNDYLVGGYMIWAMYPEYKVFIDPRYGPFWKQVGPDYMNFVNNPNPEAIKKFTSKYPFKAALIHMNNTRLIFAFLTAGNGDWRLLFFDKNAALIIHKSLVPSLSPDARAADVSPIRFKDVTNPLILSRLFTFYVTLGPQYGRVILDIYRQNVSDLYKYKALRIQEMTQTIYQKELEIRQKMLEQQQQQQKK